MRRLKRDRSASASEDAEASEASPHARRHWRGLSATYREGPGTLAWMRAHTRACAPHLLNSSSSPRSAYLVHAAAQSEPVRIRRVPVPLVPRPCRARGTACAAPLHARRAPATRPGPGARPFRALHSQSGHRFSARAPRHLTHHHALTPLAPLATSPSPAVTPADHDRHTNTPATPDAPSWFPAALHGTAREFRAAPRASAHAPRPPREASSDDRMPWPCGDSAGGCPVSEGGLASKMVRLSRSHPVCDSAFLALTEGDRESFLGPSSPSSIMPKEASKRRLDARLLRRLSGRERSREGGRPRDERGCEGRDPRDPTGARGAGAGAAAAAHGHAGAAPHEAPASAAPSQDAAGARAGTARVRDAGAATDASQRSEKDTGAVRWRMTLPGGRRLGLRWGHAGWWGAHDGRGAAGGASQPREGWASPRVARGGQQSVRGGTPGAWGQAGAAGAPAVLPAAPRGRRGCEAEFGRRGTRAEAARAASVHDVGCNGEAGGGRRRPCHAIPRRGFGRRGRGRRPQHQGCRGRVHRHACQLLGQVIPEAFVKCVRQGIQRRGHSGVDERGCGRKNGET